MRHTNFEHGFGAYHASGLVGDLACSLSSMVLVNSCGFCRLGAISETVEDNFRCALRLDQNHSGSIDGQKIFIKVLCANLVEARINFLLC